MPKVYVRFNFSEERREKWLKRSLLLSFCMLICSEPFIAKEKDKEIIEDNLRHIVFNQMTKQVSLYSIVILNFFSADKY